MKRTSTLILMAAVLVAACAPQPEKGIRHASPLSQGMSAKHLALIDSAVNASIAAGDIPGAVVGVVRNNRLVYEKAFGYKSLVPEKDTMTVETMFDLASVSKCVGTTLSFMQLVEQGKVRLVDPVTYYFPEFKNWVDPETKEEVEITVQDLLTHSSGLAAYLPNVPAYIEEFGINSPDSLMMYISTRIKRNFRPGTQQLYSCLNFITLQNILEKVTGERLCDYAQKNVFDVLGLEHTTYFPLYGEEPCRPGLDELAKLCAPTELQEDGHVLKAEVHDPTARLANAGNSGNAGVFSNVEDLAVVAAALLNDGSFNGHRILSPLTVKKMFTVPVTNAYEVARALGFDTYYTGPYTSGDIFCVDDVRGHTGYTGTSMILDPETNTAVIVLAHRVHPKDEGSTGRLRSVIASIVAASIGR
ncbi:MAG: hypothetical protein E7125_04495 [Bacteroidales bacterium]|nr:hypothetical protein [Bacteroidales bacterium]